MFVNLAVLQGRLVRDPEIRKTSANVSIMSNALAIERPFKGQDGQKRTDFINIEAWRQTAEYLAKYAKKGDIVHVVGTLQVDDYTNAKGEHKTSFNVIVQSAGICSAKKEEPSAGGYSQPSADMEKEPTFEVSPDDLPFY